MIAIDGAEGEGGGQMLRSALSLSLLTGKPFRMVNIRLGRRNPGLARQHLACVQACCAIADSRAEGAEVGATALTFAPGAVRPGRWRFEIGTAGAVSLLLHTLYLPLCLAAGPSELELSGGTHVPWSPSYEYLERCWAPLMARLGLSVSLRLERAGFYPPGGGRLAVRLAGGGHVRAVDWTQPVAEPRLSGVSLQAGLQPEVAERQAQGAAAVLAGRGLSCPIAVGALEASSPGTAIALVAESAVGPACVTGLGERGVRAEVVGRRAAEAFVAYLETGAPLDAHAADQLVLPLALAGAPSTLLVARATAHLAGNARVIERFLPVRIATAPDECGRALVRVLPR